MSEKKEGELLTLSPEMVNVDTESVKMTYFF